MSKPERQSCPDCRYDLPDKDICNAPDDFQCPLIKTKEIGEIRTDIISMTEEADEGEHGLNLVVTIMIPQMTTVKSFRELIIKRINTDVEKVVREMMKNRQVGGKDYHEIVVTEQEGEYYKCKGCGFKYDENGEEVN